MHYTSILACNATTAAIIQASLDIPTQELASTGEAYWASAACLYSSNTTLAEEAWKTWVRTNNYGYVPSAGAGIFFLAAFALTFLLHAVQLARSRRWIYLCTEVGLILELWGWGERYHASYVFQLAGLTCGPTMFSVTIYCLFSQFAATQDPALLAGMSAQKVQTGFIVVEVLAILIQVAGASLAATTTSNSLFRSGCNIMVTGIGLQLLLTLVFLVAFTKYFLRLGRATRKPVFNLRNRIGLLAWGLVVMNTLVTIRGTYRIIELAGGIWGPVATNQIGLIVCDAVPMLIVAYGLNATHAMWTVVPFEREKQRLSENVDLGRYDLAAIRSDGSAADKAEAGYSA